PHRRVHHRLAVLGIGDVRGQRFQGAAAAADLLGQFAEERLGAGDCQHLGSPRRGSFGQGSADALRGPGDQHAGSGNATTAHWGALLVGASLGTVAATYCERFPAASQGENTAHAPSAEQAARDAGVLLTVARKPASPVTAHVWRATRTVRPWRRCNLL